MSLKFTTIDVDNLTEKECIDELLKQASILAITCKMKEEDFFNREFEIVLKPNN